MSNRHFSQTLGPPSSSSSSPPRPPPNSTSSNSSWNNRVISQQTHQPYDGETDPYNPFTRTEPFQKHMKKQKRLEKLEHTSKITPKPIGTLKQSMKSLDGNSLSMSKSKSGPPSSSLRSTTMSTISGGLTFSQFAEAREDTVNPTAELTVLKSVLLREGYIRRLHDMSADSSHTLQPALIDLLDIIRISSVEVIEAIALWRKSLSKPIPFMFNGINYLLKMPSDLDFLNELIPLVKWLGFSVTRNPFVIPLAMDMRPSTGNKTGGLLTGHESREGVNGTPGFMAIGGNAIDSVDFDRSKKSPTKKIKTPSNPYSTPVINDPSLLQLQSQPPPSSSSSSLRVSKPKSHKQQSITPSTIGDLDMLRLRTSEKAILQEEAIQGSYSRDKNNRLVPTWKAEREGFTKRVGLDDNRPLSLSGRVEPDLAPFAAQSGFNLDTSNNTEVQLFTEPVNEQRITNKRKERTEALPGRAIANKIGGSLHALTTAGTAGRKKAPTKRSRGAILDMDITRGRRENDELEKQLLELQSDLNIAKNALIEMESQTKSTIADDDEEKFDAAVLIQSEIRRAEASTKRNVLKKRQDQINEAEAILTTRNQELNNKKRELAEKEEQRKYFKQVEKRSQDTRRARELERKRRMLSENSILPEDEEEAASLEDTCATLIQRLARGSQARVFYTSYKLKCDHSATVIQGGVRGMFTRQIVRFRRKQQHAATTIKRVYRGVKSRERFFKLLDNRSKGRSCTKIQKLVRGRLGKNRMNHKRSLVVSAKSSASSISVRQLFPADIMELADAIQAPLIDSSKSYLPSSVLGLIKITSMALQPENNNQQVLSYSRIGVKSSVNLNEQMTWETAMKFLRRSSKLLRRMRALSSGPAARRPRLLHLSPKAIELFKAYENDPTFTLEFMRRIGPGAKCCIQLLTWLSCLIEVCDYQLEFLDDIGEIQPGWIKKLREKQREKRKLLIKEEITKRSVAVCADAAARLKAAGKAFACPNAVMLEEQQVTIQNDGLLAKVNYDEDLQEKKELNEAARILADAKVLVDKAERVCLVAKGEFKKADADSNSSTGSDINRNKLPRLRAKLIEAEVVLRDAQTQAELCVIRAKKDDKKRVDSKLPLNGELIFRCSACGEAQALHKIALEERRVFASLHGGLDSLPSLKGQLKEEAATFNSCILAASLRVDEMNVLLRQKLEFFELDVKKNSDAEASLDAAPDAWDEATEEEGEEDKVEDERMAQAEKEKMKEFIPPHILTNTADRPRPLLICIARDVPMVGKQKLLHQLLTDLEGMFVRVSVSENQGVDIKSFQAALDSGSSIIVDVDAGISASARSTFLHAIAVTKKAMIPNPMCIMIMGDNENRKGNGAEIHIGAAEADLRLMRDGDLKRRLQMAAHTKLLLRAPAAVEDMVKLSQTQTPPTAAHVLVMEAVIVLLSPSNRFRHPDKNIAAVSWQASRRLLSNNATFQEEINSVDKFKIPDENLGVLQNYLNHSSWPATGSLSPAVNPLLANLHSWATNVIEFGAMLRLNGGSPSMMSRRNPLNLFSAVLTMTDAATRTHSQEVDEGRDEDEDNKVGWKATYSQMISPLLEDVRVFREARNINGEIYTINVFLDCNRLFFSAYNPTSSVNYVTSIHTREINNLIAPNSVEREEFGQRAPPQTRDEMFSRLVHLLVIENEKQKQGQGESQGQGYRQTKTLACKRKLKRLLRETRRISGHLATITISEDSLGELRCQAYLPQFSADLEVVVKGEMIFRVLRNADEKLEREQFKSTDAMTLLRPVADRLFINPRLRTIQDMGLELDSRKGKNKGTKAASAAGIALCMRMHGGCSRTLFTCTHFFAGVIHVVTVGEVGRGGMLRIRVYDPVSCEQHEIRLSEVDRALVIEGKSGDWRLWKEGLLTRLSLMRISKSDNSGSGDGDGNGEGVRSARMDSYRANTKLDFNRTIFKTAKTFNHKMFAVRVTLAGFVDVGDEVEFRFVNLATSEEHVVRFTESDMIKISGLPENSVGVIKTLLEDKESREAVVREMLKYVFYDLASDELSFKSEWMDKIGVVIKSKDVIKLDSGRVKVNGVIIAARKNNNNRKAVHGLGNSAEGVGFRGEELRNAVIRGRRQIECSTFASDIGKLLEEDGEHFEELYELDKERGFDYKPLGIRFVRGNAKVVESDYGDGDDENRLSVDLQFDRIESINSGEGEGAEANVKAVVKAIADLTLTNPSTKEANNNNALDKLKENRLIFNQGVKVVHGVVAQLSYEMGMVMKVYETFDDKLNRNLKIEIYSPKNSGMGVVSINGDADLREVVGPHVEDLLLAENEEEMFYHIAHKRMKVAPGLWNADNEQYEANADHKFTVILTRNRLFSHLKQTPLNVGGLKDAEGNRDVLIDRRAFRGRKILRKAFKVSGVLLQVQVFEIQPLDEVETANNAPSLRIMAYDPATGNKTMLELSGSNVEDKVKEDEDKAIITDSEKRYDLADAMCQHLRLLFLRNMPPELVFSDGGLGFDDTVATSGKSGSTRPSAEKQKMGRSTDLLLRAGFNILHVDVVKDVSYDGIVSVFVHHEVEDALRVNIYVPRISESCEIAILAHEQEEVLGGRRALSYARGEAIQTAISQLVRCLFLATVDDSKIAKKKNLIATFDNKRDGGVKWRGAYTRLETDDVIAVRPEGQGSVVFIPSDTKGDLIVRKGMVVSGKEVLVTVSTRAKGEKGGHGLVFEAYDAGTSVSVTLHVITGELKRLVGNRMEHLEDAFVKETVSKLLRLLVLEKGSLGHLVMRLDLYKDKEIFFSLEERQEAAVKRGEEGKRREVEEEERERKIMSDFADEEVNGVENGDEEEDPEFKLTRYENVPVVDIGATTSVSYVSGPVGVAGSVIAVPGKIAYFQGGEEKEKDM